ncbi:Cof-type HAD-IIB family hydrolase [Halanaerocella petrolearia]
MSYKLVAIDLDGTLLDDRCQISEYTKRVLLNLKEEGVKIILASGRPYQSMLQFAKELDLNTPLIVNNGALIKQPDENIISQEFIPSSIAERLLSYARREDLHISFYFPDRICVADITEKADVHIKEEKVDPQPVGDLAETLNGNLINILFNVDSYRIEKVVIDLKERFADELSIAQTTDNYIDIMAANVTKGAALEDLMDQYHLNSTQVLTFGNNYNDLSMLELADCGVAMDNAPDEVKQSADRIAKDNNQDGVALILEELFF